MKKFFIIIFILLFCFIIHNQQKTILKEPVKTISFSTWGSETELPLIKNSIKEFEKNNPNIKIKLIHIPKSYFQKVHLLIASRLAPDVIFINNIDGQKYIRGGALKELNPFIKGDKTFSKKIFFDKSIEAFEYNNNIFAIPRDVSNLVIYYNKDLFDKYSVKYPDKNWSFNDFLEISKKLTIKKGDKVEIFGTGFETRPLFWLPFLWSNGGGIIDNKNNIIINKSSSISAIDFYSNLRNLYHVAPTASEAGSMTMGQMFMNGKIAMQINGRWAVPRYRKDLKFNWDIVSFPNGTSGSIVDADASGWAISKQAKYPESAWEFIKFMSEKESMDTLTKTGLIIPSRKDIAFSDTFLNKKQKPENSKTFIDIIEKSITTPSNENYNEIIDIVDSALEPVWAGEKKPKEVLTPKVLKKLKKIIKRSTY